MDDFSFLFLKLSTRPVLLESNLGKEDKSQGEVVLNGCSDALLFHCDSDNPVRVCKNKVLTCCVCMCVCDKLYTLHTKPHCNSLI